MKKVLAVCLMIAMAMTLCVSSYATFIKSPSVKPGPGIEDVTPPEDCPGTVVITPYPDRDDLPEDLKERLEEMYDKITSPDDFEKILEELGIDGTNLSVSDLFNIHIEGCTNHANHGEFDVTLSADTLEHFVGLIHMNEKGEWEIVDGAKVSEDGEHLIFNFNSNGPLAIVVDTGAVKDTTVTTKEPDKATQTGDFSAIFAVVMVASATAIAVVAKSKKQEI